MSTKNSENILLTYSIICYYSVKMHLCLVTLDKCNNASYALNLSTTFRSHYSRKEVA